MDAKLDVFYKNKEDIEAWEKLCEELKEIELELMFGKNKPNRDYPNLDDVQRSLANKDKTDKDNSKFGEYIAGTDPYFDSSNNSLGDIYI